jgi:hypothetical protein
MSKPDTTIGERARAAFGQSLGSEVWAVRANELAWKARQSRLLAFQSREAGCSDPAAYHDRDAATYESMHADWVARISDIIRGNDKGAESHE